MVGPIRFGKPQKTWVVIRGDAILSLVLVCSADLDVLCSASFSLQVKFYSLTFMHKISTRVVYVKGKQPSTPYHPTPHLHALRELTRKLPQDKAKRQEGRRESYLLFQLSTYRIIFLYFFFKLLMLLK